MLVMQPLKLTALDEPVDIKAMVKGGGSFGQGSNAHHGSGGSGGSFGGGGSSSRRPSYSTCTQQNSLLSTDGVSKYYLPAN